MKNRNRLLLFLLVLVVLSSCARAISPAEAASGRYHNHRCMAIK